jgi:hypothetical protein
MPVEEQGNPACSTLAGKRKNIVGLAKKDELTNQM